MNSLSVLVTGSRGYIGACVVPKLIEHGYEVAGVDTGWFLSNTEVADFSELSSEHISRFDAVIHLAGLSDDKLCDAFASKVTEINVSNTISFATRCKQAGVKRFILASSAAVYGNTAGAVIEDHPANPETVYSTSKVEAEQGLLQLNSHQFSVACLRFGSAYGDSPEPREDLVLNRLAKRAIASGEIGLFSDGKSYRPFVHVDDIAAALVHAVACTDLTSSHNIFNVSHPQGNLSVGIAVETLAKVSGARLLDPHDKPDPRSYQLDTDRFIATGFTYQWPIDKGLGLLVRQLKYQSTIKPEQDRVKKLGSVFDAEDKLQTGHIASVSPSTLNSHSQAEYLSDVSSIIQRSSYRLAGAHSCTAAELLLREYQASESQHALTFRSGTDALTRALQVLGVKAGSAVAMPDQCFHAVAVSVLSLGAKPVLIDTRADDFNLDAQALDMTLANQAVDCVIAVDNYGTPADWQSLAAVTRKYNVPLIVDACESLGAQRHGQQVVESADVVVVSFSFTKPIHAAGMGGALIADRALTKVIETDEAYLYRQLRLPEINAAYLVNAWKELHTNINHLRDIYATYNEVAQRYGFTAQTEYGISTRIHAPFLTPVGWSAQGRDQLIEIFGKHGISVARQFACQSQLLSLNSDCTVSSNTASRVITLPTGGGLSKQSMNHVKDQLGSCIDQVSDRVTESDQAALGT